MKSLLFVNLLILLVFNFEETAGTGDLTVDYISFDSRGKDSSGDNCDYCFFCTGKCDPIFKICLRYGHSTTTFYCSSSGTVSPKISTGEYVNTDKVTFGATIGGTVNPVVYSTNNQFDGKFEISMLVTDEDGVFSGDDDIDLVIMRITASKRSSFSNQLTFSGTRTSYVTTTIVRYKFVCDANYYGSHCTVYCVAHDDTSGHYTCNTQTGAKICITGYSGANCDIGTCSTGYQWNVASHSCVDINECPTASCEQTCTNTAGSFQCSCGAGYYLSSSTDCSIITFDTLTTGSALSSTSLRISWQTTYSPTTHTASLSYEAYYRNVTLSFTSSYIYYSETTGLQIDVTGLLPYRNYELYVAAIGSLASKDSNHVTVRTNQDTPSQPPSSVSGTAISATEITVYWSDPSTESQNGVITGYVILVNSTSNSAQGWTTTEYVISASSTFYTITNLIAYKVYSISISAATSVGRGPYSDPISVQTAESAPSASPIFSLAISTATSITLTLQPPTDTDAINGVISYYLVTYTGVSIDTSTRSLRVMPPSSDYLSAVNGTLTALQEGVSYTITVVMYTSVGGGPNSGIITVSTEETAPTDTPQNVQFSIILTTSFFLLWDSPPPIEQNGVIIGYRLAYRGVVIDTQWRNSTLTTTNASITNLYIGTEYTFHICALTSAGEGPCISVTHRTLELLPTGAPAMFTVENIASTYLSFSWSPPPILTHNGVLLGYTLEAIGQQYSIELSRVNVSATTFFYQFTDLEEHYRYTILIRARNSIGYGPNAELNVSTTEASPEGSPSNLTAVATATSITIKWTGLSVDQQNGQLTNYEVTYITQATFIQHTHVDTNVSVTELEYTVNGLEEDLVYNFRVRVYTAAGPGPYSTELSVRTDQALPSNTPTSPQLTVLSATQIQVQWGPVSPIDQNGLITGFDVRVSISTSQQIIFSTTQTSYTLDSLKPYTEYFVQIRANNSVGPGPYTPAVSATTNQAPPSDPPTQFTILLVTHSAVNCSWSQLSPSLLNGVFISYSVRVTDTQAATSFLHTSVPTYTLISDLTPYTQYSLAVAAVNTQGAGPYSAALLFTTNQSSPTQGPEILTVIHLSPSSVILQWRHIPTNLQNGPVISYTLTLTANSGTLLVASLSLSSLTNSTTLTDLHPYTEYTIQLTASNIAGTSPPTYNVFVTAEDSPSGPPTSLLATPSTTYIILLFLPPLASEQNGVIILYTIRFGSSTYNTTATQYTLVGLQEATEYEFSVAAWTSVGRGPFSAQISATTLSAPPSAPPQNVTGKAESYQSILMNWFPVPAIHQNGEITSYIIYYQGQEHDTTEKKFTVAVTNTQTTIKSLKPDEEYFIFIVAQNSQGTSPSSSPIKVKTLEGLPTAAPTDLVLTSTSPSSFTVTWVGIEPIYHNGLLLNYDILFQGVTFDTLAQRISVNSSITSTELTNLHPANEYTVFVFALNMIGRGPESNTVSILLPESVPSSAPTIESVSPGSTTILVVWGPIDEIDRNGVIILYEVRYTDNLITTNDSEQTYINVSASVTEVKLKSLLVDTYYKIQVRGITIVGPGPFSFEYLVSTAHQTCTVCDNGKCTPVGDENICVCNPGFTGETCESNIDECADVTCVRGSCLDGVNSFTCECDSGFKGQLCDLAPNTPICAEETSLNFLWPDTAYGETAMLPCSQSDALLFGDASRACTAAGTWSAPDVSECMKNIYAGLDPGQDTGVEEELTPTSAVDSLDNLQAVICNDSNNPSSGPTFFPSEIIIVVSFLEAIISTIKKEDAAGRAQLIPKLMPGIMCILSGILDSRNLEIFYLSNGSSNAIAINELLEEVAKLNADNYDTTKTHILFSEDNLNIYISPLTAARSLTLPDYSLSAVMDTGLYPDSVDIPQREVSALLDKSNGVVPVIAVVFSRYLGQAIGTHSLSSDIDSSSTVSTSLISIQNNLGEPLTFSSPISLTFSQLTSTVSSLEFTCVYWNSLQGWTTSGLGLSKQATGSVTCESTHATSFTVLKISTPVIAKPQAITYIMTGTGIGLLCLLLAIVCCCLCLCICLIRRRRKNFRQEALRRQSLDPFLQQDGSIVNPLYGSSSNTLPAKDGLMKGEYEAMQFKQENPYYYTSTKLEPEVTDLDTLDTFRNSGVYSSINYGAHIDDPYSEIKPDPSMNPFTEMAGGEYEELKLSAATGHNPFIGTFPEPSIETTNVVECSSHIPNPTYQSIEPQFPASFEHVVLGQDGEEFDA